MEVGPFRTISGSKTESGSVEVELVDGGWEEFATVIFSEYIPLLHSLKYPQRGGYPHPEMPVMKRTKLIPLVDQPPGTGYSFVPTNGYLHDLDEVSFSATVLFWQ